MPRFSMPFFSWLTACSQHADVAPHEQAPQTEIKPDGSSVKSHPTGAINPVQPALTATKNLTSRRREKSALTHVESRFFDAFATLSSSWHDAGERACVSTAPVPRCVSTQHHAGTTTSPDAMPSRLTDNPRSPTSPSVIHEEGGLWFADEAGRAILCPVDPAILLAREHRRVQALKIALGSEPLFTSHIEPLLFRWAAMVQGLPFAPRGLYSNENGLLEVGLDRARAALSVLDARVIEPYMPPMARDAWSQRLRVALVAAALLTDAKVLAGTLITASIADGEAIERFIPGLETLLGFGERHRGATYTLHRLTDQERAQRLSMLPGDLLRLSLTNTTRLWLASAQKANGETVLTALQTAVQWETGLTDTERLIAEAVAQGSAMALNRRARERAQMEGSSPLLLGFGELFRAGLRFVILRGLWPVNRSTSALLYAEDGLYLRWPQALTDLMGTLEETFYLSSVPDEPDLVAELLTAQHIVESSPAGLYVKGREGTPTEGETFLALSNPASYLALARRAAAVQSEVLPVPAQALRKRRLPTATDLPPSTFWMAANDVRLPATLKAIVDRVNRLTQPTSLAVKEGLFIPEGLIDTPLDALAHDPRLARFWAWREQTLPQSSVLRWARAVPWWREVAEGPYVREMAIFSDTPHVEEKVVLSGLIIKKAALTLMARYEDGTQETRPWPKGLLRPTADEASPRLVDVV